MSVTIDPLTGTIDTILRLADLMIDADAYDEDFRKPTREAYDAACEVIRAAADLFRGFVPRPSIGAIGDGGLAVQWGGAERYVRLLVPPDPAQGYIYSRAAGDKAVEPTEAAALARRFGCLAERRLV